jgi:hypothetical protein
MDQRRRCLGHAKYPRGEADMGALRGPPRWNGERETEEKRRWLLRGESPFPPRKMAYMFKRTSNAAESTLLKTHV